VEHGLEGEGIRESQLNGLIKRYVKLGKLQEKKEGKSNKILLVGFGQDQ
jgi:hypothetical protein